MAVILLEDQSGGILLESGSGVLLNERDGYSQAVMADGAIGYWRAGEPSGTILVDQVGANNGSYVNAPTLGVSGAIANDIDTAVTLNGTDEYATVPDANSLDQGNGPLSWELWFKKASPVSTATQELMAKGQNAPTLQLYNGGSGDHYIEWYQLLGATPSVHSLVRFGDTDWHHVVGTKSGADVWLIYIDGVECSVLEAAGPAISNTALALEFGRREVDNSRYFNGTIDEVAIYNVVLTAAQVAAHYNAAERFRASRTPLLSILAQ